jgi:hypothetical protein
MLVHPLAPFRIIGRKHGLRALVGCQRREESLSGLADRCSGYSGRADGEKTRHDLPIRRHTFECFGKPALFEFFRDTPEALEEFACGLRQGFEAVGQ